MSVYKFRTLTKTKQTLKTNPEILFSKEMDYIFATLCGWGKFQILKLIFLKNPNINIFAYNNRAFLWCCISNHINILKWLWNLKPITNMDYCSLCYIFNNACYSKCMSIVFWLLKRMPTLEGASFGNLLKNLLWGVNHNKDRIKIAKKLLQVKFQKHFILINIKMKKKISRNYDKHQFMAKFI
ncbi:MAG: hypothetical protein EBU01_15465 [Crocinitomicaceae bacterium]|nr:hypothetical protein [Crocinitomicaceae bacterium]